jgi:hypothetical protein
MLHRVSSERQIFIYPSERYIWVQLLEPPQLAKVHFGQRGAVGILIPADDGDHQRGAVTGGCSGEHAVPRLPWAAA